MTGYESGRYSACSVTLVSTVTARLALPTGRALLDFAETRQIHS
jgi:hypothetical protein